MGDIATSSATTTSTRTAERGGRGRHRGYRGGRGGGARNRSDAGSSATQTPFQDASSAREQLGSTDNSEHLAQARHGSNVSDTSNKPAQPRSRRYRPQRGRGGENNSDPCYSVSGDLPESRTDDTPVNSERFNRGGSRGGPRVPPRQFSRGGAMYSSTPAGISFNPYAAPFVPGVGIVPSLDTQGIDVPFSNNFSIRGRQRRPLGPSKVQQKPGSFGYESQRGGYRGNEQYRKPREGICGVDHTQGKRDDFYRRKAVHPYPRKKLVREDGQELSMRESLIQQLEDDCYECAICCQIIYPRQGIWTCKTCYHMFHISGGCIINWAKKSKEEDNKWRCPTCQTKYEPVPYNYFCFCHKERNPTPRLGETPHSCGNMCGGQRAPGCPHPCNEPCHPGPCPECPVMLTRRCNCGSVQKAIRCGSAVEVKCDKVCGRLLACGEHRCEQVCHEGKCGKCEVVVNQVCYCGSSVREVLCWETNGEQNFSCGGPCKGMYSCGNHRCTRSCHPISDTGCGSCPSAPERITHCPCGKCTVQELKVNRASCKDPIPTCRNMCGKVLQCGSEEKRHRCRALCHTGECPPCELNTSVVCRCKQVKRAMPCKEFVQFAGGNEFLCERRCKKRKSCGIHKCQEVCCVQTEHICMQICNKRLSCGLHFCENICHAGQCPRCLNSSFEEQYCHCGRTMRPPPIPCGAPLPECDQPCARPHACNHPVTHRCHGEERCPPCTALVERMCYGGHELRKNIPCHIQAVSCGRVCDKPLGCGVHNCIRNCHAGDCLRESEKCTRPCMIPRRPCEHPCALPCHGTAPCPESECAQMVNVTCECGKRRSQMKCSEFEKMVGRLRAFEAEDSEGANGAEPGVGALRRSASMEKLNCLPCDDECKKIARNKRFAEALELVTDDNGDLEKEPTITYTEYVKGELRTNAAFVQEVEADFLELLEKMSDPTYLATTMNFNFRPMALEKRRFIHEYASYFSIETTSVDDPPKRSVIATARRGISRSPLVLLTSLLKYPSVLKARGAVTLKSTINDDAKRSEHSPEENGANSMKMLRGTRPFKQRVAPKLTVPPPLPQFNHFAALCSDDDEPEDTTPKATRQSTQCIPPILEKDPDWWSDDNEEMESTDDCNDEVVKLMKDMLRSVCQAQYISKKAEEELEFKDCKDSWSDDE